MRHVSINVSGKVQGVFFRASTKEKADELMITGTVRNNEDGSVMIEAEGEELDLEKFIAWCKQGPRLARVDRCDVKDSSLKNFTKFSIER
jgi:acylphosphatase